MDYEPIRAGLAEAIPFNQYVGIEVLEIAPGRSTVRLPDDERLRNHVGSQHAGALFAAGEAASGGAFLGTFAERLGEVTPLAESAQISYRRIARGPIQAIARLGEDRQGLMRELDDSGVVRFPVDVELTDADGDLVAEMVVHWHVRRRPAADVGESGNAGASDDAGNGDTPT